MEPGRARELAVLMAATFFTRWLFRSHRLYDLDSVNFALALGRFDPSAHQPHPPGYFLYIWLGRLVHSLLHDANTALVALSVAASCGAVAFIYLLAADWFGRLAARMAALVFLFSPLAWFHGTVALTYMLEGFFSALLAYLCWRARAGDTWLLLAAGVVLGVAAGFRPSSLLILGPLLLFSWAGMARRPVLWSMALLALTLLAWSIPMLRQSGGLVGYAAPLWSLWRLVPGRATVYNSSPFTSLARFCTLLAIYGLGLGSAALLPLLSPAPRVRPGLRAFSWVWVAPSLLLFTFIFLKFVNSGYLLVLLPAACVWLGARAAGWYEGARLASSAKLTLLGWGAAVNCLVFLWAPVYCSYGQTRAFEAELDAILSSLPQVASPGETLIVGFDSHFLGYRHAGYYLPDYLVVQYPEVPLGSGTGVFLMQHRDTRLAAAIPVRSYKYFVLFPLPSSGREYRDYLESVRKRFPAGQLRTITRGACRYTLGPAANLAILFPSAAH